MEIVFCIQMLYYKFNVAKDSKMQRESEIVIAQIHFLDRFTYGEHIIDEKQVSAHPIASI